MTVHPKLSLRVWFDATHWFMDFRTLAGDAVASLLNDAA